MPQRTATIESLPMAFALVKEMQADGLEWGEGYRSLGRAALLSATSASARVPASPRRGPRRPFIIIYIRSSSYI